jgi:hypothetical protein
MNSELFHHLSKFPKQFKAVKIIPAELEAHFKSGKSLEEIAAIYGMKEKSLQSKIRNSLSLSQAMKRGKADFESFVCG